jgi:hypothetical protein
MERPVSISAAVEGLVDEAVARRLIVLAGGRPGPVYGKNGKSFLRQKILGYNNAARHFPWLVLVDLDQDADCAPPVREEWLPDPAPNLCFRVAVREVESWLMADAEALAGFLSVARSRIPPNPENLDDPKVVMVNLARHSRRLPIRVDMVPRPGSGRVVGPAYVSRLVEYILDRWRPEIAAKKSDSLRRAIECLNNLVKVKA